MTILNIFNTTSTLYLRLNFLPFYFQVYIKKGGVLITHWPISSKKVINYHSSLCYIYNQMTIHKKRILNTQHIGIP